MNDLMLSAQKWIEIQKQIFEADVIMYSQEIGKILMADRANPNEIKMLLGKIFIWVIKKEMQHGLVKAWIFGSTSRGEANEKSDVDIALLLQKKRKNIMLLISNWKEDMVFIV